MTPIPARAVALTAVLDPWLPRVLREAGYQVMEVTSGYRARDLASENPPDVAVLDPVLDDMSGTDACRLLRTDPTLGRHLPILILFDGPPTPELRVAALRVGAWDFLSPSLGQQEVLHKLATYIEAKRTVADAIDDGLLDPASGFCSLPGLARRARELAALMTRVNGPLACVVIEVEGRASIRDLGGAVGRAARLSDVVGDLGSNRLGVLAPGTTAAGAIRLASRLADALTVAAEARWALEGRSPPLTIRAGFDVIANAKYTPVMPFELLQRAALAVKQGLPQVDHPWIRRYGEFTIERRNPPSGAAAPTAAKPTAHGVVE